MRIAAVVLFVLARCAPGPAELLCRDTCNGCCAGETCLKGDNISRCGTAGGKCSDCFSATGNTYCSPTTRTCAASGTGGGGGGSSGSAGGGGTSGAGDAGTGGSSGDLAVTIRYQYPKANGGGCLGESLETCVVTKTMTQARFSQLSPSYSACTITSSGQTVTLDCSGFCSATRISCTDFAGKPGTTDGFACSYCPKDGLCYGCAWVP